MRKGGTLRQKMCCCILSTPTIDGKLTALDAKGQADEGSCVKTQTHSNNELLYSVDTPQFETMLLAVNPTSAYHINGSVGGGGWGEEYKIYA